jgi:beta-lactamase class A
MLTRRQWLTSAALATCGTALAQRFSFVEPSTSPALEAELKKLEAASGGRLGVAVLNTANGRRMGYRTNERFPMCSTFKFLAVAAVLKRVDQGKESLDRRILVTPADVLSYAPITSQHVGPSGVTIAELCAAAITLSDNTAANLLLKTIGGPSGVTNFASSLGDPMTRLERNEPTLNEALPGDPRDTTTPAFMVTDMQDILLSYTLSPDSRTRLTDWLLHCKTGDAKIRAGLPPGSKVGDKTGSGERGTSNDVAIIWPPLSAPWLLAIYLTGATVSQEQQNATIAAVAKACNAAL